MCVLIVLHRVHPDHPVLAGANRDEERSRPALPPALLRRRRTILCPLDARAGGTWLGLNDAGLFAALANDTAVPPLPGLESRGLLVLRALDETDASSSATAVQDELRSRPRNGFRLLLADAARLLLVHGGPEGARTTELRGPLVALSNDAGPGAVSLPAHLQELARGRPSSDEALEGLRRALLSEGSAGLPLLLRRGGQRGTVSSTLVAVHRDHPAGTVLLHAAGSPDETPYVPYQFA